MKILLVNDDGWNAPGLSALETLAKEFGEVWSAAPNDPMSGCGHQLTLHQPIAYREIDPRHLAVSGTPADCVRVALARFQVHFDWVWSGINEGSNLGCDIYRSGTVAAAREAALLGISAIAVSQFQRSWRDPFDWTVSQAAFRRVWKSLSDRTLDVGRIWNVNLPDPAADLAIAEPAIFDCQIDPSGLPMKYENHGNNAFNYIGIYSQRPRIPGFDIDVCFNGSISVSMI